MNKGVPVTIDGVQYRLRFPINSLVYLEELTGLGGQELIARLEGEAPSFKLLRHLVQAAFYDGVRDITAERAGELIDRHGDIMDLVAKAAEALSMSFPSVDPDQPDGADTPGNAQAAGGAAV